MPRGIWKNGKDLQMRKNPGGMGVPASGIIASRDAVARTWRLHPARVTVAGEVEGVTWERRTGSASQPRRSVFILGRRGAAEGLWRRVVIISMCPRKPRQHEARGLRDGRAPGRETAARALVARPERGGKRAEGAGGATGTGTP